MKIMVLGSGVVGVTTAYYLACRGHEVVVVERCSDVALETSYANAGHIAHGHVAPWAAPGIPFKAIKWLFQRHSPLAIRPTFNLPVYTWLFRMFGNCNSKAYLTNMERVMRLACYSRDCLLSLRQQHQLEYEARNHGTLQLSRSIRDVNEAARDITKLKQLGVECSLLDQQACLEREPALARVKDRVAGGLLIKADASGDCYLFTRALAKTAMNLGVKFIFGHEIKSIRSENDQIKAIYTDAEEMSADAYVCALGSYSTELLRPLGVKLPVYPVKGYSLTIPIKNTHYAPQGSLVDESYKVAISRFNDRIRIGGMAELSGFDTRLLARRRQMLEKAVNELFPDAGDFSNLKFWTGLRPMTPDSTPIIGPTRYSNLYLNTGHGTLGWTMSCGSGALLADVISGLTPSIRNDDLSLARYD